MALARAKVFTPIKVRKDSFYAFNPVKTASLNNCANVFVSETRRGQRVEGYVYREKEKTCAPTNFAAYERDTEGMSDDEVTEAFIPSGHEKSLKDYGRYTVKSTILGEKNASRKIFRYT